MRIDEYASGSHIRIAGKTYRQDLKIVNDEVKDDWWRKDGHRLDPRDIEDILDARPKALVIGTGYAEGMRVPQTTMSAISALGIRVIAEPTPKAVQTFNRLTKTGDTVAGAFHLTC
ncbi:MAG: Mth938-like domain-containing protein [Desulfobacterales bacterium]